MLIRILPIFLLFLTACGGPSDEGNLDVTPNDSLSNQGGADEERVTAVDINNELSLIQSDMYYMVYELFTCDIADISSKHKDALFEIDIKMARLDEIQFDGTEKNFVQAVKDLGAFYQEELNGEFLDLMPAMMDSNRTNFQVEVLENYDMNFAQAEESYVNKVYEAQVEFSATNNINLEGE